MLASVSDCAEALEKISGRSLGEAAKGYLQTVASVRRKDAAEAVAEFIEGRKHKSEDEDGKRSQLSRHYCWRKSAQFNRSKISSHLKRHKYSERRDIRPSIHL